MIWAGLVVLWTIAGISHGQNATAFYPFCDTTGGNYIFTLLVEIKNGDPFEYLAFEDSVGTDLTATCSTTGGQITGSGNTNDPYNITIVVQPAVDINLGSPDCGHFAAGDVLNWTVHLVQAFPPPIPGASGFESTEVFTCDFGAFPDNPTINITLDTGVQPHHLNLTQEANVLCSKNGTIMTLRFDLTVHNDNVDIVFARNSSDPTMNTVGTFDSMGNGITGNGSVVAPYAFSISADCAFPTLTLASEAVSRLAYSQGDDILSIVILAKSLWITGVWDTIVFPEDVIYTSSCNCSEVQDYVLSTGEILVSGQNDETPNVIIESAILEVWDADAGAATTSVALGDDIFLAATVDQNTQSLGAYLHSCFICDALDCVGLLKIPIIGIDGCSTLPQITPFTLIAGQLRTDIFEAFKINDQPNLWFQCTIKFCYKPTDTRCPNFCAHNNPGRRKRQALIESADKEEKVFAHLTIRPKSEPDTTIDTSRCSTESSHETQMVWLIAVAMTIAGLLLIDLIVHMTGFYYFSNFIRHSKKRIG